MSCNGLNRRRISDGQQVIRCLDAALRSLRARVLVHGSVPVGRGSCLNADENTVLGSLCCGHRETTGGKDAPMYVCIYMTLPRDDMHKSRSANN